MTDTITKPGAKIPGVKEKGELKTARIPIKIVPADEPLRKPAWIRVKAGNEVGRFGEIKKMLREQKLHTVCEEAACPNIGECFGRGTATFMILGDICTRRCPFCDVGHGKPLPPDTEEPANLADSVAHLKLRYVVITSVDRDVLNHNLETVPRLYKQARPGADYQHSLDFLKAFKERYPQVPTKSGLMVGIGETDEEILEVMRDLRAHGVEMLTIGQYLAPSGHHLPVVRYVHPDTFKMFESEALKMGFTGAACGPMVRSSYWADKQAHNAGVA